MGPEELLEPIRNWRTSLGQTISADVAVLLSRSLRTLEVRVRARNTGAEAVARFLAGHPRVAEVRYPALLKGRAAGIAARQMRGGAGMVTFVVDGDAAAAAAVVDRLRLIANAVSPGSVEASSRSRSPARTTTSRRTSAPGAASWAAWCACRSAWRTRRTLIADLDQALGG